MNFFGLNQATLNGGVSSVVLAGALGLAGSFGQATPTVTVTAAPITLAVTAVTQADGVRMVAGAGTATITAQSSAAWGLVMGASATANITAVGRATYVAALSDATSTNSATGFITRLGDAIGSASSSGLASGLRTATPPVPINVTAITMADASVKRAGQVTTERDGYALATIGVTTTAAGEKQTLGIAIGGAYSEGFATGIKAHGGRATILCGTTITAIAAHDYVFTRSAALVTAQPNIIAMCAAGIVGSSQASALSTVTRFGAAKAGAAIGALAGGQVAVLGRATIQAGSVSLASARTANLGEASGSASSNGQASGTAILLGQAMTTPAATATAAGTRIQFGAALARDTLSVSADAIANPAVAAPADRSMRVAADDRSMRVPYEDRTMKVNV